MVNRYRLASTIYDREKEEDKVALEKVIFLSVEGNISEKEYCVKIIFHLSLLHTFQRNIPRICFCQSSPAVHIYIRLRLPRQSAAPFLSLSASSMPQVLFL